MPQSLEPLVVPLFGLVDCPPPSPSGVPVVSGPTAGSSEPVSWEAVRRVIRQSGDVFAACYRTASGQACHNITVNVSMDIDAAGNARSATVGAAERSVEQCTTDALLGLRFPAPSGGGAFRLTFVLEYRVE